MIEYKSKFKVLWQFLNKNISLLAFKLRPYLFGYNSYTCLLTQTGSDDPTAIVLHNSLAVGVTFTYDAVGTYSAIFDKDLFPDRQCYVSITSAARDGQPTIAATTAIVFQAYPFTTNVIQIEAYKDGVLADSILGSTPTGGIPCIFEIRKYN